VLLVGDADEYGIRRGMAIGVFRLNQSEPGPRQRPFQPTGASGSIPQEENRRAGGVNRLLVHVRQCSEWLVRD
jgi:hypothetical protein